MNESYKSGEQVRLPGPIASVAPWRLRVRRRGRTQPGEAVEQRAEPKRLDEVAVRSHLTDELLGFVIIRGEEQDRNGVSRAPQGGADLQTISVRKDHRENDDVIAARAAEPEPGVAVVRDINRVPVVAEAVRHEPGDGRMLDDQNLHRATLTEPE